MKKETKEKLIYKSETDRTPAEKTVRNCVFMAVIMYVALLTWLFLNSQINVANAESDLASACLSSNINVVNTNLSWSSLDDANLEDTELVSDEVVNEDLVEVETESEL